MSDPNTFPNVEELHTLATQLLQDPSKVDPGRIAQPGSVTVINVSDALQVAREGETLVIWGNLDASKVGEAAAKTLFTVSFEDDSVEPSTFLRWDEVRQDNGEGYSIPKRQRNKIAGRMIELFAA